MKPLPLFQPEFRHFDQDWRVWLLEAKNIGIEYDMRLG